MVELPSATSEPVRQQRAPRLPLRAPITFVTPSDQRLTTGWTVNISRSGVLFETEHEIELPVDCTFVIELAKGALGGPGVPLLPTLRCSGRLIRQSRGPDGAQFYAVRVATQNLEPRSSTSPVPNRA